MIFGVKVWPGFDKGFDESECFVWYWSSPVDISADFQAQGHIAYNRERNLLSASLLKSHWLNWNKFQQIHTSLKP